MAALVPAASATTLHDCSAADAAAETNSNTPSSVRPRVVILPGNGCTDVYESNWYGWLAERLQSMPSFFSEVVLRDMPDPIDAKESIWLPFMKGD
jgi:hypothetical protein